MTTGMALLCVMEILANASGEVKEETEEEEEDGRGRRRRKRKTEEEDGRGRRKRKKGGALKTVRSQAEPGNEGLGGLEERKKVR